MCHNSSACHVGGVGPQPFFVRVSHFKRCVTNGNGAGANNVFKRNRVLGYVVSIQSSVYDATTVAKVSLFSTWTQSTVSFYSM